MNWPLVLAVAVLVPELISLGAALLQRSRIGSPLPSELQGIYDQGEYETSMNYTRAKSTYSLCKSAFDLTVFFVFWLLHGFPWLDGVCVGLHLGGDILTGMVFIAILGLASQILDLPWDIYFTFVLEEKFGFNKTTPATFVKDRLKALALGVALGGPILATVLWFLLRFGTGAWLWVFIFITCVQLLLLFLMPAVLLPIFMEMIPLPTGTALISSEDGSEGKALAGFLSGRAFYTHSEACDGKTCWTTNDRRFAGSKAGATLSIRWSSEESRWVMAEGEPSAKGTVVYAVASTAPDSMVPGAEGAEWSLTAEAKAEASGQNAAQINASASPSDPLVPAGSKKPPADSLKVICVDAGSLRSKVLSLAERLGYHGANIFVIDGSARSSHSNAFCTGFGSFRRICLFDTLLPVMSEGEILAVLGHEIGHDRLYHVHTTLVVSLAYSFVMLYALGHLLLSHELSVAFFVPEPKVYLSVVFFSFAWGAIDFMMSFVMSTISRSNEFAADRFSVEADRTYGKLLCDALKKLMKKSKVNLTPHPLYVALTYSHPPLDARIKAIQEHHHLKYE